MLEKYQLVLGVGVHTFSPALRKLRQVNPFKGSTW